LELNMPLSAPAARKLIHTRKIECNGYERADGLWDIEAQLMDTKTFVHGRANVRQPGEPIHHMRLRVTIDLDMIIHDAEAITEQGPYSVCGDIAPNFKRLIGVKIGPGWRREIRERLGGIHGCTHLVELLGPLGTTAFQSTGRAREAHNAKKDVKRRPYQLGQCHVYAEDSPAVLERWPDYYKPKAIAETNSDS